MIARLQRMLSRAVLLTAATTLIACAGEPERKDQPAQQPRQTQQTEPVVEVEEPSAEELANQPCGNPDWAQMPVGAEDKAPEQTEEPAQDAEEAGDEQSSNVDIHPEDQPCT